MAKGRSNQLTRQIGEHLVVAKLGRLGLFATPFAGNVPDFDLVVANESGESSPIQVKAINGPSWQFKADTFLNIEMVGNKQIVKGKRELPNPKLVCVFVLLRDNEDDEFYVFRLRDLQAEISQTYKSRVRPRNPSSKHCAVWPKQLLMYRDNWHLVKESLA